ncbi:hypothetical protein BW21_6328 (plasmid) [Burkholderia humptydooensis]|nr:hypothetical protein BW21_6328 [Burkholderia sp. 2002721687]
MTARHHVPVGATLIRVADLVVPSRKSGME